MIFIRYGDNEYKPALIQPVRNAGTKPKHGTCLWGSPAVTDDWRKWATEHYPDRSDWSKHFLFEFRPWANVLELSSVADFAAVPLVGVFGTPDFELLAREYSAVWLTDAGLDVCFNVWDFMVAFYGWDCSSVAVFDPKSIYCVTSAEGPTNPLPPYR
jgi:hypothetical protein